MAEKRKPEGEPRPGELSAPGGSAADTPGAVVRRAAAAGALGLIDRIYMLLAAGLMAFAGLFLLIGWQFGPLVLLQAKQYGQMTSHVDARIVESWLALEFDPSSVRVPEYWRASTNAARCVVAEYDGDWGAPLRRAYCGTRVPFNESYLLADLRDISPGVAFGWAKDERGFVVPEIRMAPATREWLAAHASNKFMHRQWPANTALDWLRIELDRPDDAATYGWTAPPRVLPLAFDPANPAEALPTGIVNKRMNQQPNWIAMLMGFIIGGVVWFKALALIPVLRDMAPAGRWILSALPLLTLPWWMDSFPRALTYFSRDVASVLSDMFADVAKTDRLVATNPAQATLASGERMVWRLEDSVYAETIGHFKFVQPGPPPATQQAALDALTATITIQTRAQSEVERDELFASLERDKRNDLTRAIALFVPAAKEVAADPSASTATRRAARHLSE